ncbi:unnamed protein product [Penicillium crustosum]
MTDLLGTYTKPLAYLGLFALGKTAFSLTRQATTYLLPSNLQRYNTTKTNWALVTGATDGIGFGFGQELCARGFNVILHGRNPEKLDRRRRELQTLFPAVCVAVLVRDAQDLTADIDDVDAEVRDIIRRSNSTASNPGRLTVLINNVGGETKPSTLLKEYTFEDVQATVSRNATFAIQITRVLAAQLEENAPGLVMNVSSLAAFGLPYISIYSSTKGFVDSFTKSLRAEFAAEGKKVEVMGLRVAEVSTPGNLFIPEARVLAAAALDRVGCGQEIVWAYFWHWLQGLSFEYLPRGVLMKIAAMKLKAIRADQEAKAKSS